MIDMVPEAKQLVLDQLRGWLELEFASFLPEAQKKRQHRVFAILRDFALPGGGLPSHCAPCQLLPILSAPK